MDFLRGGVSHASTGEFQGKYLAGEMTFDPLVW